MEKFGIISQLFGKHRDMETTVLSAAEALEYGEFKRSRREAEVMLTLKKLTVDASRRETDKSKLKSLCESAVKLGATSVLTSPVNAAAANRLLFGSETCLACLAGGTGESLISVKKTEAKKAMKQGAAEIRLAPCYSALVSGNVAYLKREFKRVKKAVKKCALVIMLDDPVLDGEEIARGVRTACEAKADGVCVRGELPALMRAVKTAAGRLSVCVSHVENAEQLRLLLKAGASGAVTAQAEKIAEELYFAAKEGGAVASVPAPAGAAIEAESPKKQD